MRQKLKKRFNNWLDRRQPMTSREVLSQHNIYIVPSSQFVGFFTVTVMIWIAGTNYENNLILAMSFFLLAIFVSAIFMTHSNLSGLELTITGYEPVFAGEKILIHFKIDNPSKHERLRILLKWDDARPVYVDVEAKTSAQISLQMNTENRGWFDPGRLRIETRYPLGILRAWSWPKLNVNALVYPKPLPIEPVGSDQSEGGEGQTNKRGIDDFGGLEEWQPGISANRIAWKQYSAGKGLLEKTFEAQSLNPEWLEWDQFAGYGIEERLSGLCRKILDMEALGQHYGLRMPGKVFPPSQGEVHLHRLLSYLAGYGLSSEVSSHENQMGSPESVNINKDMTEARLERV